MTGEKLSSITPKEDSKGDIQEKTASYFGKKRRAFRDLNTGKIKGVLKLG
jgi:hypothetical protein